MTKLFVQLFLSVMVGIGAAVGFNPKVRAEVHESLSQANASLHESVGAVATSANKVTAKINTAVSAKTNADASSNGSAKADLKLKNDLKAQVNADGASPVNFLPGLSVNSSLTNGTSTNLGVDDFSLCCE